MPGAAGALWVEQAFIPSSVLKIAIPPGDSLSLSPTTPSFPSGRSLKQLRKNIRVSFLELAAPSSPTQTSVLRRPPHSGPKHPKIRLHTRTQAQGFVQHPEIRPSSFASDGHGAIRPPRRSSIPASSSIPGRRSVAHSSFSLREEPLLPKTRFPGKQLRQWMGEKRSTREALTGTTGVPGTTRRRSSPSHSSSFVKFAPLWDPSPGDTCFGVKTEEECCERCWDIARPPDWSKDEYHRYSPPDEEQPVPDPSGVYTYYKSSPGISAIFFEHLAMSDGNCCCKQGHFPDDENMSNSRCYKSGSYAISGALGPGRCKPETHGKTVSGVVRPGTDIINYSRMIPPIFFIGIIPILITGWPSLLCCNKVKGNPPHANAP